MFVGGWRVAFVAFRLCFTSFQWLSYVCSAWSNFWEDPVEHNLCPSKWVQLASAVPVRLTNYATVGTSVDDLVLDERQKTQAEHGKKCVASQTFCWTPRFHECFLHTKGTTSHPTRRQDSKSSMCVTTSLEKNSLEYSCTNYIQKKHVETLLRGSKIGLLGCVIVDGKQERVPFLEFRFNLGPETLELMNCRFWKKDFEDEKKWRYFWTKVQYNRCRCRTLNISCPFWLTFFFVIVWDVQVGYESVLGRTGFRVAPYTFFFHAKDVMFEL